MLTIFSVFTHLTLIIRAEKAIFYMKIPGIVSSKSWRAVTELRKLHTRMYCQGNKKII